MMKRLAGLLSILSAFACGCAAVPEPRYYRVPLDIPTVFEDSLQSYGESLRIARFDAIVPLRQDSIVTYQEKSTLIDYSSCDFWESSPSEIVSRQLAHAFRACQLLSRVDRHPVRPPAKYLINGKIQRFNQLQTKHGLYGEVALEVQFIDQGRQQILWTTTIRELKKAEGDDSEAAVLAVSEALGQCIVQILQQVKQGTAYHEARW